MTKLQITLSAVALLAAFAVATPAFAEDNQADVSADVGAVQKDNDAIAKDNSKLARHRAAKAHDKANDKWGSQAIDSVNIGSDKAMRSEKKSEKDTDKKILHHDVDEVTGDKDDSSDK